MPDSDLALGVAQLPVLAPSLWPPLSLMEKTCVALSPFPSYMCRTHLHLLNAADPIQISAASFSTFSDLGKWPFCPSAHRDCGIATTSERGLVAIVPYIFPRNLPERDAVWSLLWSGFQCLTSANKRQKKAGEPSFVIRSPPASLSLVALCSAYSSKHWTLDSGEHLEME